MGNLTPLHWGAITSDAAQFAVPAGTVTFLLTDVEGSTKAWESDRDSTAAAMVRLEEIVANAVGVHNGVRPIEQGEGDSAVAAFAHASDAVACALEIQRTAPLPVRIGIHTGEAQRRDAANYFGQSIHRAARIRSLAHGGQTLLSRTARDLASDRLPDGAWLQDAGTHRLRDLSRPEQVYQLCHADLPTDFPPLRSLDSIPNNLPVQLTTFIGREREIDQVAALVREARLVTLTGSGGCGKTRLALQFAADVLEEYPDGVWVVELAPNDDPMLVPDVAATACRVQEILGQPLVETMRQELRGKRVLLVVDNCEHVVDAIAALVRELLTSCPELTVLATSRTPLSIDGEVTWRVPSLSLPAESELGRIEALTQYEAFRLFIERAKRARPNFTVTEANAPAIAQICHRLEGIPLAIELAAARTRMMDAEQILSGLSDRFRLLIGGARTVLPRQQTLEASVDWSYALLSSEQKTLLCRLSVFAGSFNLDAAEAVGDAAPLKRYAILGLLSDLVDHSLVNVEEDGRYRLLETVRIYAARHLEANDGARERHLAFFVDLAEDAGPRLESREVVATLHMLDAEHPNLRAAHDYAVESGRADAATRLVADLTYYWMYRGHLTEARRRCDRSLEMEWSDASARCRALVRMAMCAAVMFDQKTEVAMATEALELALQIGDAQLMARARVVLADGMAWRDPASAADLMRAAEAAAREVGDLVYVGIALVARGQFELMTGELEASRATSREGIQLAHQTGDFFSLTYNLIDLSMAASVLGDLREADEALDEVMRITRLTDDRSVLGAALGYRASTAIFRGDYAEARRFVDEARSVGGDRPMANMTTMMMGGTLAWAEGRWQDATEAISVAAEMQRHGSVMFLGWMLATRGLIRIAAGDREAATRDLNEAIDLSRRANSPIGVGLGHLGLATLEREQGDAAKAETLAHEALTSCASGYRVMAPDALELVAALASDQESYAEGARLFGAAEALREQMGSVRFASWQAAYEADSRKAREFNAEWAEGRALSLDDAVGYAQRGRGERKRPSTGWASLTPAELQIVPLVAQHLTNAQIGEKLFMSPLTVKTHLQHIYAKVGISSRGQLAAEAVRRGIYGVG